MGRKIIFSLANFETNAVDATPNYYKTIVGTSRGLWDKATSRVAEGNYGFLSPVSGLLTGAVIKISNSNHNKLFFSGKIYDVGSATPVSTSTAKTEANGITYLTFSTPLKVQAGQVVSLHCPPNVTNYLSEKGDVDTYTNGTLDYDSPRCFQYNLIVETTNT